MSGNAPKVPDTSRGWSHVYRMTMLLLGLAGCVSRPVASLPTAIPAVSAETVQAPLQNPIDLPNPCALIQIDSNPVELDAALMESGANVCTFPGGTVRFASKCAAGPSTFLIQTPGGFFTSLNEGQCPTKTGTNRGWVSISNNVYVITLSGPDDYCDMAVNPQAGTGAAVPYWVLTTCNLPVPLDGGLGDVMIGKLEVVPRGSRGEEPASAR
jgi:hypothetical protein